MDLQLIKTFLEVAQSGSFAAASDRLFVTQSAVSLRVQRLEDQLGQPLFTRSSDGVTLTTAGEHFQPHAAALLHHWQAARQAVSQPQPAERLNIAMPAALTFAILPAWLSALLASAPELAVRVNETDEDVFVATNGRAKAGYISEPLGEVELALFAAGSAENQYIEINWGDDFMQWQGQGSSAIANPLISLDSPHAALVLMGQGAFSAYLPSHFTPPTLAQQMDAPKYALRIWAHWRVGIGEDLRNVAQRTLQETLRSQVEG